MVLYIARACPALRKRSCVRRQRWPVPWDESEGRRARAQEAARRGQELTRMNGAVSLRAQAIYPSLEEDDLDKKKRSGSNMNDQNDINDGGVQFREVRRRYNPADNGGGA